MRRALGERATERQYAVGPFGAHIAACEDIAGGELANDAYAYEFGFELGCPAGAGRGLVGRCCIAWPESYGTFVSGAPEGRAVFIPWTS